MHNYRKVWLKAALVSLAIFAAGSSGGRGTQAFIFDLPSAQESIPSPPADRTLIYFADEKNTLAPLAFEVGTTPLNVETVAKGDKRSYVELKGENSASIITDLLPRFYLFLPDRSDAKPPFI